MVRREAASSSFGDAALEPLINDQSVGGKGNAVQVNDLSINNQLDVDGLFPASTSDLFSRNRGFALGWSVDANTRARTVAQPKTWTAPQNDGCPLALDLQDVRPCRLKFFSFRERDCMVQQRQCRAVEGP